MAFHDQLTGLPNRRLIRELLAERLHDSSGGQTLAVLFLDLDNFKQINDNLGHAAGDELLRALTSRLSRLLDGFAAARGLRGSVSMARFGGDELLIALDQPGASDAGVAGELADALLEAVARPVALDGARYVVTASIGIALFPRDALDADGLVRCADLAMYGAKARGRNAFRFYSADLNARAAERLRIERRLRQAVAGGHLAVHYQPIVDLADGHICALEALLRWTDPELGTVSPARFIPIAEETGLIRDLALWTLDQVCARISAWRTEGLTTVPVAVNVSAAHLQREDLAEPLSDYLAEYGLSGADLEVEITESVLMDLNSDTSGRLRALGELGVAVHIDDFGTGWSSLDYLRRFAIESIKIDRSFVAHICDNEEDRSLAEAMIAMAHALNLRVIAEGIEQPEQHALLRRLGCDQGQGFLFARPGDAQAVAALLRAPVMPSLLGATSISARVDAPSGRTQWKRVPQRRTPAGEGD
jgi:diguanylate cyclase (GGDEF)-like protein